MAHVGRLGLTCLAWSCFPSSSRSLAKLRTADDKNLVVSIKVAHRMIISLIQFSLFRHPD